MSLHVRHPIALCSGGEKEERRKREGKIRKKKLFRRRTGVSDLSVKLEICFWSDLMGIRETSYGVCGKKSANFSEFLVKTTDFNSRGSLKDKKLSKMLLEA